MRPFGKFTEPYYENYTKTVEYNGGARDVPVVKPQDIDEVRIGFLGPVENHPDEKLGRLMLNGAQLAIEEANAAGGYGGKPFRLMIHNDQAVWGASSNEIVKMAYDEKVWAMLGSISADSTHIALRVSLKAEVPDRQQRRHRPHDSRNHHSLVSDYHSGRSRPELHARAADLHRPRAEESRAAARQRPLWPLRRAQVQGRRAAARPSRH